MMGLSWNFPTQAEPSWKGSEPSQAWELQFSSWNRADNKNFSSLKYFFLSFFFHLNLYFVHFNFGFLWSFSSKNNWFSGSETVIFLKIQVKKNQAGKKAHFRANFWYPSWEEKVMSQAKPSWKSFSWSYGSSQLRSDPSLGQLPNLPTCFLHSWTAATTEQRRRCSKYPFLPLLVSTVSNFIKFCPDVKNNYFRTL